MLFGRDGDPEKRTDYSLNLDDTDVELEKLSIFAQRNGNPTRVKKFETFSWCLEYDKEAQCKRFDCKNSVFGEYSLGQMHFVDYNSEPEHSPEPLLPASLSFNSTIWVLATHLLSWPLLVAYNTFINFMLITLSAY